MKRSRFQIPLKHIIPLLFLCLAASSCQSVPEQLPVSDSISWYLPADITTNSSVTIAKGQKKAEVVAELGQPKYVRHFQNEPDIEVLSYLRTVAGPVHEKQISNHGNWIWVRSPIYYDDKIEVYLKAHLVVVVTVQRSTGVTPARMRD